MLIPASALTRLQTQIIAAGVSINSVNISGQVQPSTLQAAAQLTIDAFDTSQAAQDAWQVTQDRAAAVSIFMTDHSVLAKVLRGLALVLLDRVNALETELQTLRNAVRVVAPSVPAVTYPQFTPADEANAVQTKINSGAAD